MADSKSRILIIGGTGCLGKFIVEASLKAGHQTFALVRESTAISDPVKGKLIQGFKNSGATILTGDLNDHRTLVDAIKQADVVISVVGHHQWGAQDKIIAAIKDAGNIKRFIPSEFGNDADLPCVAESVEPAKAMYETKAKIRRAIEAQGIPYTFVIPFNLFSSYSLSALSQLNATTLPRDKVTIFGDGNANGIA